MYLFTLMGRRFCQDIPSIEKTHYFEEIELFLCFSVLSKNDQEGRKLIEFETACRVHAEEKQEDLLLDASSEDDCVDRMKANMQTFAEV